MDGFTQAIGLSRFTLYMQDYGGPVGFRMTSAHPERVEALIVQDAVAHNEGLGVNWKTRRAFWADRAANEESCAPTCSRLKRPKRAMSATIPTPSCTTPISGPTNTVPQRARPGPDSERSLLRLPHQCRRLSKWQAWMQKTQAQAPRHLGQARSLLRSWRARALSQRRAQRRGSRPRRRPLRARHQAGRNRHIRRQLHAIAKVSREDARRGSSKPSRSP